MPTATTDDGVSLYYEVDGSGQTVVFVGEAGLGAWQWGWQHGSIAGPYRTVVWDLRGTGRSETPAGPYTVDRLAADLERVLSDVDIRNCNLVGAGLGGMIALRYAREFSRAETLVLFNTAASGEAFDIAALRDLVGLDTRQSSLPGGFSEAFRSDNAEMLGQIERWRQNEDAQKEGLEAQLVAVSGFEAGPLYELTVPTLVCQGLADPVVPAESGENLASDLPRGVYQAVEGGHLCFIEHSRPVNDRLLDFIDEHSPKQ